ncbi:MAG TPA: hypothetical protein VFZ65_02300 [Planctomycetota bacterium]|nr:hypothetical protein [Planctomycetota bacterium]
MNDGEQRIVRCRQAARALHRALGSPTASAARAAAVRFTQLPTFAACGIDELLARRSSVGRAQAHDVIAWEHGFVAWAALLADALPLLRAVTMYTERMSSYQNRWFVDHAAAAASLRAEGGYLLPFRRQFFVASREAVAELGIDPDDPDWARIGFDWVQPRDAEAHLRLSRARFDAMLARGEHIP